MIDAWRKANAELMGGATKVIAPSEFVKKEYEKNYKNLKIEVIPHGVDVEKIENLTVIVCGEELQISHPRKKAFTDALASYAETKHYV